MPRPNLSPCLTTQLQCEVDPHCCVSLLLHIKTKKNPDQYDRDCAQDRSRTGTSVTSQVFETSASTNSATWAIQEKQLRSCIEVGSGFEPL